MSEEKNGLRRIGTSFMAAGCGLIALAGLLFVVLLAIIVIAVIAANAS